MTRSRGRAQASSPEEIAARRALKLGLEVTVDRQVRRTPEQWGVSAEIHKLPTSSDVTIIRGARDRVVAANRSDAFDLLHDARGLTDEQHAAARRLFRDFCLRAGVRDRERQVVERVDGGRADPSSLVTDAMVDAGRRIAVSFRGEARAGVQGVGPVNAKLLEGLISPMVDQGLIIAWRGTVQRITGEKDRNAQGAMVRQACQSLVIVYDEMDAASHARRKSARDEPRAA